MGTQGIKVVGGGAGISPYIAKYFGAQTIRLPEEIGAIGESDHVIICARQPWGNYSSKAFEQAIYTNCRLISDVCSRNPRKIIFFSSVDVYSCRGDVRQLSAIDGLHIGFKKFGEQLLRDGDLIIRPGLMVNDLDFKRDRTTLGRVIRSGGKRVKVGLSGESCFFVVCYSYVLNFLNHIIENDLKGIVDVVSPDELSLAAIVERYDLGSIEFGCYTYRSLVTDEVKSWEFGSEFAVESIAVTDILWRKACGGFSE